MKGLRLTASEMKLANILWENQPMASGEMVETAEKQYHWNKSTTYTILRSLCDKSIFQKEKRIIYVQKTKEQYYFELGYELVTELYDGKITKFVAAYVDKNGLSKEEAKRLASIVQKNIDTKS